jgi:hypothetical protein
MVERRLVVVVGSLLELEFREAANLEGARTFSLKAWLKDPPMLLKVGVGFDGNKGPIDDPRRGAEQWTSGLRCRCIHKDPCCLTNNQVERPGMLAYHPGRILVTAKES